METIEYTFKPDEELLKFADFFSKNWKTLEIGNYASDDNKYQIEYLDKIIHFGSEPSTNIRVGQTTGTIEISKSKLQIIEASSDFIFFSILWCVVEKIILNTSKSDIIAMEYYIGTGKSVENVMTCWEKIVSIDPTEVDKKRLQAVTDFINSKKAKIDILYWHELMAHFSSNPNGTFNVSDLCQLDTSSIKICIEKGYSLKDIQVVALKIFKTDKRRYETLEKFINDFESNIP